jgi:hypothetical protein
MNTTKRYRTVKPLYSGGTFYPPGSVVELAEMDARWAADIGVIEPDPVADPVRVADETPVKAPAPARLQRGCRSCGWH